MSADPEPLANGINHVFSILPPEWRRVAHELIAEMPHRTVPEILAAVLAVVAREERSEAEPPSTTTAPAHPGHDGEPGTGREAEGQGPGPVPPAHPTTHPRRHAQDN
ncbi:hypothetical protein [Nonomuraea jabiensis]|uniref:hypothetical protein n=1 Tax=Nonomuraea jabiensis TaxID=882448 RepID=UPI003D72F1D7